ncbi:MAG: NUDIX hydrolase, partial [Microlunatus sp.]|nr:NUDIX hydrolase [Microlunatus sp.]
MASHSFDVLASLPLVAPATLAEMADAWPPSSVPVRPRLSASVVLCRDGASGLETYLLHRHARMAFAASMVVFPGGGVDAADASADDPFLTCALRETEEETGVALDATDLIHWARWITPEVHPLRYDTVFYLAGLPPSQSAGDLSSETESAAWTLPSEALTAYESGRIAMMPPTHAILIELAGLNSVTQLRELGRDRVVETVLPEVVRDGDGWAYRYP